MTIPTDICPGCRELWTTLPALHFCTPQDARSVKSDSFRMSANVRMTGRGEPMAYEDSDTTQVSASLDSDAVAAEVAPRAGRPDIETVRSEIEPYLRPPLRALWPVEIQSDRADLAAIARKHIIPLCDYAESLERELAAAREDLETLDAALCRWIDANEAFEDAEPGSWRRHELWMEACEATVDMRNVARAALAREAAR